MTPELIHPKCVTDEMKSQLKRYWYTDPVMNGLGCSKHLVDVDTVIKHARLSFGNNQMRYVISVGNKAIGFLTLTTEDDGVEIGISISDKLWGKGIGTYCVGKACEMISKLNSVAYAMVSPTNERSKALFQRCGFNQVHGETMICFIKYV